MPTFKVTAEELETGNIIVLYDDLVSDSAEDAEDEAAYWIDSATFALIDPTTIHAEEV